MDIIGEDDTSIASHVKVLQDQYQKTQPDPQIVEERMMRTFAWRRQEIANGMTVEEAINKYPFLKSPCGVCLHVLLPYICVEVLIKLLIAFFEIPYL